MKNSTTSLESIYLAGCGSLGHEILKLIDPETRVCTLVKSSSSRDKLLKAGVHAFTEFEGFSNCKAAIIGLPGFSTQLEFLQTCEQFEKPESTIFISSTGFYEGLEGVISDDSPRGNSERAQMIAKAEDLFLSQFSGTIIRSGGLFQTNRGPFSYFKRSKSVPAKPGNQELALLHYEDLARLCLQLFQMPPQEPVLATIPQCPTRNMFYQEACQRIGMEMPELPQSHAKSFQAIRIQEILNNFSHPNWMDALS